MSISLKDEKLIIPQEMLGSLGLLRVNYRLFSCDFNKDLEEKIRGRIKEILSKEGGYELLEKAVSDKNPERLKKLYGFKWVLTNKDLSWYSEIERIKEKRGKIKTNLLVFEFHIEKIKKAEEEDKIWKRHCLNQEYLPFLGTVRAERLKEESIKRHKRSLSESDASIKKEENDLFIEYINGRWKYIEAPPIPFKGLSKTKMEKKKRRAY